MTSVRLLWSLTVVLVLVLVALAGARPQHGDSVAAASGHHHGRVQIKVYRGPDEHGHKHHEHFAPHGYWIKQPADDGHHH